jgi:hypothetical protein
MTMTTTTSHTRTTRALTTAALIAAAATGLALAAPTAALAATDATIDFTSAGYTLGPHSPRGQNGWNNTPADWDFSLVSNDDYLAAGLPAGGRSLQVSNAIVTSSSRYLTSPPIESAGETGAVSGNTFTAEFTVASATGGLQPGLNVDVNVDAASRFGGVVNLRHTADGLAIGSYWLPLDAADTSIPSWRSAVFTTVPADVPHVIRIVDVFLPGQQDVMQVYVDGVLVSGGSGATTWEAYYAIGGSATDATVDQVGFKVSTSAPAADGIGYQTGIPAAPATAGLGYLFSGLSYSVSESAPPVPTAPPVLAPAPVATPDIVIPTWAPAEPGAMLSFDLVGYLPYENVAVVAYSTPIFLGWFQADATGRVSGSVAIPAALEGGTHTLQLTGASSGFVASGSFTLLALAASGAEITTLWLGLALLGTGGVLLAVRAGGRRRAAAPR